MSPSLLDLHFVRRFLQQRLLVSVPTDERVIALTFDDGPSPVNTPTLLDLLESKGIEATFFVVGKRCREYGAVLQRIAEAGHEFGNHGFHHLPMNLLPRRMVEHEIRSTEKLVLRHTGLRPRYFRPPFGWFSERLLTIVEELGYHPVIGSIHPHDSRQPSVPTLMRRMRRGLEPGAVIILHDGGWREMVERNRTLEAVDRLTDELGEQGYRFLTISGLLQSALSDSTETQLDASTKAGGARA